MSKYDPLARWLRGRREPEVSVTFAEVEEIIKDSLPPSARLHSAWWANENADKTTRVQGLAWVLEGWRAYPDLVSQRVTFRRSSN